MIPPTIPPTIGPYLSDSLVPIEAGVEPVGPEEIMLLVWESFVDDEAADVELVTKDRERVVLNLAVGEVVYEDAADAATPRGGVRGEYRRIENMTC